MKILSYCLICCALPAQMLVVDRGISKGTDAGLRVGRIKGAGFVADHFRMGASGEIWIIDTIRVWGRPDGSAKLGDLFENVTLFGGIEAGPLSPGQPDCDCHNLMTIKSARLHPGADQPESGEVMVSAAAGMRQIDFRSVSWSVPGGVDIQFGVMGVARGGKHTWYNQAAGMAEMHPLKIFDDKGKLEGPYAAEESKVGLNVQVWGHKSVSVAIRSAAATIEIALSGGASFDVAKADPASLHLGPKAAAPFATRLETVDGHPALIVRFRRTDTGLDASAVNACLAGRQLDGVPFEGCDLLRWGK